jgi:tetratricopeptide (TPR) repeat protein
MRANLILALSLVFAHACHWEAKAHQDLTALIEKLTAQISTNQNDLDALLQRADLYRLHTNWTEARMDYAAAQKLSPDSMPVLLGLAQLHVDMGEDSAARSMFDAALSRQPTNCTALFGRGQVLARLGERKAAIADYSRGLALTPFARPDLFLERSVLQAAEFGIDEAIKGLDEGLARLGWMVTLQMAAIELELERQRIDEALVRLETIITRSNRKETWLARKGEILLAAGKTQDARDALSAALNAIDGLQPRMRTSPGMTELRAKVERLLASTPVKIAADKKN